ncbi:MAG TPA: hypothetical protein VFL93_17530 [Longimicrobiaceae bacterium]|nr:hypothetical protein [Longimicrobiaceae bacterium]
MHRKSASTAVCVTTAFVLVLAGCESTPTGSRPCRLVSFTPTLAATGLTSTSVVSILDDAANRVVPVLVDAGAAQPLDRAVRAISAGVASGETESTCRAFNEAAAELTDFAASAPRASLPDLESFRLALGLARSWIHGPRQPSTLPGVSSSGPRRRP